MRSAASSAGTSSPRWRSNASSTWRSSSSSTTSASARRCSRSASTAATARADAGRMRVAYYSPLPPARSGIADYSSLLLPALERRVEVVLARPNRPHPPADVALFQLGNDPRWHGWIYEALRRRPGLVVLHEVSLHGLVAGLTL